MSSKHFCYIHTVKPTIPYIANKYYEWARRAQTLLPLKMCKYIKILAIFYSGFYFSSYKLNETGHRVTAWNRIRTPGWTWAVFHRPHINFVGMSDRPFSIHLGIVWTAQRCFGTLLVTRFCTCEIGRAGVNYLEWDFSAQSSRRCPGAGPAHACLIAVICEWERAWLAHYASLMKRGRFSSGQAWNSQVVYPWHFSCVLSGMCGVTCSGGAEKRRTRERGGRTEGENYAFPLPKGLCCPKPAEVYGNQTGRGQMKWFGTAADVASARPLFFHSSQRRSTSARLDRWKAALCRTIN